MSHFLIENACGFAKQIEKVFGALSYKFYIF